MRTAALQLDSKLLVGRPQPVSVMLDRTIASARFETLLFTMFGVLALIVAVIGVYGLMAFWVGARLQEMGVRMALGANGWALKSLVLRQASLPLVAGIASDCSEHLSSPAGWRACSTASRRTIRQRSRLSC